MSTETIEQIITSDVGNRGPIEHIRDEVRDSNETAAVHRAAEALARTVSPGDVVVLLTGFPIPPTMEPETDGPCGAVSLARAIDETLDANPLIACDPVTVEACEATATAGGLSVQDRPVMKESTRTVAIEAFPADRDDAASYAEELLSLDPAAVIAVEKVGPNADGVYHNMAGYDVSSATAKVDELFERFDGLSIGVGDAGNEIGMGAIESRVRRDIEYGATCQCPCESGIACAIETDVLVPAAVSNWGAYGIVAQLDGMLDTRSLHAPETEVRMLTEAAAAGAIDGVLGGTTGWCDGMAPAVHSSVVQLLSEISVPSVQEQGGGELGR